MIFLSAPWDLIQATIMLPDPLLGDLRQKDIHVNIRNSINGTFYSYVKSNTTFFDDGSQDLELDRYKLSWDLRLRRGKADELKAFMEAYYGLLWRVVDWKERVYRVYLTNDPCDFTCVNREGIYLVRLELEGERLLQQVNLNGDAQ